MLRKWWIYTTVSFFEEIYAFYGLFLLFVFNHSENSAFTAAPAVFLTGSRISISLSGSIYSSASPDWPIWVQISRSSQRIRLQSCVDLSFLLDFQKLQIAALGLRFSPNWSSHSSDYTDYCQITRYFTSCTVSSQWAVTALVPGLIPGWVLSGFLLLQYSNEMQVSNLVRCVMNLISLGCSHPCWDRLQSHLHARIE